MPKLKTWAKGKSFDYEIDRQGDVLIKYGSGFHAAITAEELRQLIANFNRKNALFGTSRDRAPEGSLGDWLQHKVTKVAIASYLGPILVNEGLAQRAPSRGRALAISIL
jgi:hypothetical protein